MVYKILYSFEAFYINKNWSRNIKLSSMDYLSLDLLLLLVLNVIFPMCLELESPKNRLHAPNLILGQQMK